MNQKTRKHLEELAAWLERTATYLSGGGLCVTAIDLRDKAKALRELLRRN